MDNDRVNKNTEDVERLAQWVLSFLKNTFGIAYQSIKQFRIGIKYKTIPWQLCLGFNIVTSLCFVLRWDYALWNFFHIAIIYPTNRIILAIYCFPFLTSGFWIWSIYHLFLRRIRSNKIEPKLAEAGLKSVQGRVPKVLFDSEIGENAHLMRVTIGGQSLDKFKRAKDTIQSNLKIFIDDIRENRTEGTVDIIYSKQPMPELVELKDIKNLPACKFLIGETRASIVKADIRKVPHLLVAGQTNSGKSTFLRQFILTHYLNCPNSTFYMIDLKEGLESNLFSNLPRISTFDSISSVSESIDLFQTLVETRLTQIKNANCLDYDQLLVKNSTLGKEIGRQFILVDEAAELFLVTDRSPGGSVQLIRQALSDIARRGRAAGVHLILATQRPDRRSLDPQIKANLMGIVCFQMANDASSMTVLGNGKATELPAIPGRAIWKCGSLEMEVQTPFLSHNRLTELLKI